MSPWKSEAFYRFTFIQKYVRNSEESEYPELKELEGILSKDSPTALLEQFLRKCLINVNVSKSAQPVNQQKNYNLIFAECLSHLSSTPLS